MSTKKSFGGPTMDTRPKQSTQRNRPESGRPLNERVSAQKASGLLQSGLEVSPQKRLSEKRPAPPKVDSQYIRNTHYSHELRWIVEEDIGFSYGNQVQADLKEFERVAHETKSMVNQMEEVSAHGAVCLERIKQNAVYHDEKLEKCKQQLQEIGKLEDPNPNYVLRYEKSTRAKDKLQALPAKTGPELASKPPASQKAPKGKQPAAPASTRDKPKPSGIKAIQEKRKYEEYCDEFKRYLRHKDGVFTEQSESQRQTFEARQREKKRAEERSRLKSALFGEAGESEEELQTAPERQTGYQEIIRRAYRHMLEQYAARGLQLKKARRADIVAYFFEKQSLLKLHDFLPDQFALAVNEVECDNPHQLAEQGFLRLVEQPRDRVSLEGIGRFFAQNPLPQSSEALRYFDFLAPAAEAMLRAEFEAFPKMRRPGEFAEAAATQEPGQACVNLPSFVLALHDKDQLFASLNSIALYVLPLNRFLTLSHLLVELFLATEGRLTLVTFAQLLQMLRAYRLHRPSLRLALHKLVPAMRPDDDWNEIDTDKLPLLLQLFNEHCNADGVAVVEELIEAVRRHAQFAPLLNEVCRRKAKFGRSLFNETLSQLLDRILRESDLFTDWFEFVQYFTRRGFPVLDIFEARRINSEELQALAQPVPGKMHRSKQQPKKQIRDPSFLWNVPKVNRKAVLRTRLTAVEFVAIFGRQFEPELRFDGYKVTVPEPFNFAAVKTDTFGKKFLEELVAERDEGYEFIRLRPKSVPNHVYQPIYREMVEREEEKKREMARRRHEVLMLREQNLDLIRLEEEKANAWKEKWEYKTPDHIRAGPLPESNRPGLYHELVEAPQLEFERKKRLVQEHKAAKQGATPDPYDYLPPRFAQYEVEKQEKKRQEELEALRRFKETFSFRPRRSSVPDGFDWEEHYRALQQKFQRELDEKKAALKTQVELTAPQPFHLRQSKPRRRAVRRNYLDARAQSAPPRRRRVDWRREPAVMPELTKKFEQLVQHNKEKRVLEHNKKVQAELWEQERRRRRKEFARRVIYSPAIVNQLQREFQLQAKAQRDVRLALQKNDLEYEREMQKIRHRVFSRPLLVEQAPYFHVATNTGDEEMRERGSDSDPGALDPPAELIDIDDAERAAAEVVAA